MWDVKACRACLNTNCKLENISPIFRRLYSTIMGLEVTEGDGYPTYFCVECHIQLKKTLAFRRKCRRAYFVMKEIMAVKKQVAFCDIQLVDRKRTNLESTLKCTDTSVMIDIKSDNYEEMEQLEERRLEEIRQREIEEEAGNSTQLDDNMGQDDVENMDLANIDLEDVFKDLKEEESEEESEEEMQEIDQGPVKNKKNLNEEKNRDDVEQFRFLTPDMKILEAMQANRKSMGISNVEWRLLTDKEQGQVAVSRIQSEPFKSAMVKCALCITVYKTVPHLMEHIKHHNMARKLLHKCKICQNRFLTAEDLRMHCGVTHWYEYTCTCGKKLYNLLSLIRCKERHRGKYNKGSIIKRALPHELMHCTLEAVPGGEDRYRCDVCRLALPSAQRLARHKLRHDPSKGKYQCDVCGVRYKTLRGAGGLEPHLKRHHMYAYTCRHCELVMMSAHEKDAHKSKCPKIPAKATKPSKTCSFCGKPFITYLALERHCLSTHNAPLYTHHCTMCGASFLTQQILNTHQIRKHQYLSVNDPSLGNPHCKCIKCKVYFVDKKSFATHMNHNHDGAAYAPMSCRACKKVYRTEIDWRMHKKYCKVSAYPVSCSYCDAKLYNYIDYKRHHYQFHKGKEYRRVHHARPGHYILCYLCGKSIGRNKIKQHFKKHEVDTTKNKCEYCGVQTQNVEQYVRHILYYHTKWPYRCALCPARYRFRHECKDHILKVHVPEKPYSCEHCELKFAHLDYLHDHCVKLHGVDMKKVYYSTDMKRNRFIGRLYVFPHMNLDVSLVGVDVLAKVKVIKTDFTKDSYEIIGCEHFVFPNQTGEVHHNLVKRPVRSSTKSRTKVERKLKRKLKQKDTQSPKLIVKQPEENSHEDERAGENVPEVEGIDLKFDEQEETGYYGQPAIILDEAEAQTVYGEKNEDDVTHYEVMTVGDEQFVSIRGKLYKIEVAD